MKILVVDDAKNIRKMLTKCLELDGHEVLSAENGTEALRLFGTDRFDIAFIDIKMPGTSGTGVLRQIRKMGINTPVVIITAYATVKNAVDCTRMGAVAYLQKPFTPEKIRNVMSEIIDSDRIAYGGKKQDVLARARRDISEGAFREADALLKSSPSGCLLVPEYYLLLSRAAGGLKKKEEAQKFMKIYNSLKGNGQKQ